MQIESVEVVKSVIITRKQPFLQMISSAAEGLFFLVLLCSFTQNILLLKDRFENKNQSSIVKVSALAIEAVQKSRLSKTAGEGPEFSGMSVVLACGVKNEKRKHYCFLGYCFIWVFLITGRVVNSGVFGDASLLWKSIGAVQVLWLWSCILPSPKMSVEKALSLLDTDSFSANPIKSALAKFSDTGL